MTDIMASFYTYQLLKDIFYGLMLLFCFALGYYLGSKFINPLAVKNYSSPFPSILIVLSNKKD